MHDFSLCTPRKDILVNQNNSKVLSYIEPNQYTLNQRKNLQSPNFRKMKTRNPRNQTHQSLSHRHLGRS